jgi:hypothetical protein
MNSAGQSVTEIATGMNYWNGQQWTPSDPSFAVSPDGTSFIATRIQDPTQLAANLNSAVVVTVTMPEGVTLRSTPISIDLYEAASGLSVIVAVITNSTGVLADPQHVVYNQAFVGGGLLTASIVYSLPDTGSFHQDIEFTGFDPGFDPTVWGFAATATNTLQIQIWTEFYDPPQPLVRQRPLYIERDPNVRASMASPDFVDNFLDFGHYMLGPGRACMTPTNSLAAPGAPVAKDFVSSNGRTFLVESVSFRSLWGYLKTLPAPIIRTSSLKHVPGAKKMKVAGASLPAPRRVKTASIDRIVPGKPVGGRLRKTTGGGRRLYRHSQFLG